MRQITDAHTRREEREQAQEGQMRELWPARREAPQAGSATLCDLLRLRPGDGRSPDALAARAARPRRQAGPLGVSGVGGGAAA
jgi:hypothetical protein